MSQLSNMIRCTHLATPYAFLQSAGCFNTASKLSLETSGLPIAGNCSWKWRPDAQLPRLPRLYRAHEDSRPRSATGSEPYGHEYVDGARASRLLGVVLSAYRDAVTARELKDQRLSSAQEEGKLFGLALAAAFDLTANIEYLHGRVVNAKWIYCHRADQVPRLYYSFLKQCPRCCLDLGLGARLEGAQHKPTSHHIGEITTVLTALILQLLTAANDEPLA